MENLKVLYRAEPLMYTNRMLEIFYEEYTILKHTPKGVWIEHPQYGHTKGKFVLLSGKKRFAYPTKEEALKSLYYRKKRQLIYLKNQVEVAETVINMIDNNTFSEYMPPKVIFYEWDDQ